MAGAPYCEEFGKLFRKQRMGTGLTLRAFCEKHGLDHGNVSKLERGRLRPPTGETLRKYAQCLGLKSGADEWYEFCDTAAACAGEIPVELMSNEDVVKKLPVVFRTLGRRRPTKEELRKLIDLIRGA